jgi:thiol-disulfide isomerase/thioredoxin
MKQTIFTILILFLLAFNVKAEETLIIGKILNYTSLDKNVYFSNSLQVSYFNIIWQEEIESAIIENDGSFQITFDLPFIQDIYIKSGTGQYIAYLATPGEKIELNLEYELTNQKFQGLPSPFYLPKFENAFVGKSKLKQDKFYKFYYGWIIKERIADQVMSEKENFENQIELLNVKLNSYFEENPSQKELYNWGYSNLFFSILVQNLDNEKSIDLKNLQYPSSKNVTSREFWWALNRIENSANANLIKKYGNVMSDKIKEAILSDNTLQLSSREKELIKSINPELKLSKEDSLMMRKLSKKMTNSDYLTEFQDSLSFHYKAQNLISELPRGIADVIIAQQIIENLYPQKKCEYLNEKSIKNFTLSIIEKRKTKPTLNINDYLFSENKLISGIIDKNKGKPIYVDIWATWCGGCRAEFPKYKEIINQYGNKVKFVFLCVESPEKTYMSVLNSLDFDAEHYFLSSEQYEELKANYKVSSLPHYVFIKPDGIIINKTYRPSDKEKLFKLFDGKN